MRKQLLVGKQLPVVGIIALGLLMFWSSLTLAADKIHIGVMQIVEHPALDAARQGFIDELAANGYDESRITYDIRSAQGDFATAQTIAEKFVNEQVDMILAIATPTAQAAANATEEIPILITAVTDPVAAGLVNSIEAPGTNVTGTSDLNPVRKQLELLQRIAPAAQRVGIVYNAGETNSVVQVELAREVAKDLGLKLVETSVTNSSEVYQAAQSLVGRVDAFYVPTDNTVVSALESMVMVAESAKLPLIVGENESVRRGGLATVSLDYYELGRQTGKMALKVLVEGVDPATMPIEYLESEKVVVNLSAAKRMGVELPQSLIESADEVIK